MEYGGGSNGRGENIIKKMDNLLKSEEIWCSQHS